MKNIRTIAAAAACLSPFAFSQTTQIFDDGSTLTVVINEKGDVTNVSSTEAPFGMMIGDVYGKNGRKNNAYTIKVQTFDDGDTLTTITNSATGEVKTLSTDAPMGMMMEDAPGIRWNTKRVRSTY